MRHTANILCFALMLVLVGCDKPVDDAGGGAPEPEEAESTARPSIAPGTWSIGDLSVQRGASGEDVDLPSIEEVEGWLHSAIQRADGLELGEAESEAFLRYQASVVDGVSGIPAEDQPFLRVRVVGRLADPSRPREENDLMSLGIERDRGFSADDGSPSSEFVAKFVREVVEEYVAITAERLQALSGTEEQLVALLSSRDLPEEAALTAIHEVRDRNVEAAVAPLIELLEHDSPTIAVASAAALAQMAPDEAAGDIVEAAGRLGREREYAQLHRLIYILGDIEAPVTREYLEGLQGHQIPDIRRAATQVLERRAASEKGGE